MTSADNPGCVEGSDQGVSYSHALSGSFFRDTGQVSISRTCFQDGPSAPSFTARAVYEMSNFDHQLNNNEALVTELAFSNHSVWQASSLIEIANAESTVRTWLGQTIHMFPVSRWQRPGFLGRNVWAGGNTSNISAPPDSFAIYLPLLLMINKRKFAKNWVDL